jgi:hypothetical protein
MVPCPVWIPLDHERAGFPVSAAKSEVIKSSTELRMACVYHDTALNSIRPGLGESLVIRKKFFSFIKRAEEECADLIEPRFV